MTAFHDSDLNFGNFEPLDLSESIGSNTVIVDHSCDNLLTDFSKATMATYLLDGETPQLVFARVANYFGSNPSHAQRLYDYMSKLWFLPASPILSNGGAKRGLCISCFINEPEDSLKGIVANWNECIWMAANGGGIGTSYAKLRSIGEDIKRAGKTSGALSFAKVQESLTLCISQGSLRRANSAIYLPINHPEIEEFIDMRKAIGGDPTRKMPHLHHGITISDKFLIAVEKNEPFDLQSPKTGKVIKTVSARELWAKILSARLEIGEPYLVFLDTVQRATPEMHKKLDLYATASNLCVAPETKILTRAGYKRISSLKDKKVEVWNGLEWSKTTVRRTAKNTKLLQVKFSNGQILNCTPQHKFYVQEGYANSNGNGKGAKIIEKRTHQLKTGDKLIKFKLPTDIKKSKKKIPFGYAHGFYTGDGHYDNKRKRHAAWLYGEKRNLFNRIRKSGPCIISGFDSERPLVTFGKDMPDKFKVPFGCSATSKVDWLAGLVDSDGSSTNVGGNIGIQIGSINHKFLRNTMLMLQELGVNSKISLMYKAAMRSLPDGRGSMADYQCQNCYRLLIPYDGVCRLMTLGFKPSRVKISNKHLANRNAERFVQVVSVKDKGRVDDTYCFTEKKRGMGVFNGLLTGQCSEIMLPIGYDHLNKKRTAVCCLSSMNLLTWDQWHDKPQVIYDVMEFLDNVLEDFIKNAPEELANAKYSAMRERSVGLGVMGFHSFLQSKNVPFESALAKAWNNKFFTHLHNYTNIASQKLAKTRGPNPDAAENGFNERFTYKMAVAPTATISTMAGNTSPGVETIAANVYMQKTLHGNFTVKNQELQKLLIKLDKNTDEVWRSITLHKGSVQHLDFLTDDQKLVFKTAIEIDQRWVIDLAGDRAPFIDQAQSINVFFSPTVTKKHLHEVHMMAWKRGLKSLYYCRSQELVSAEHASHSNLEVKQREIHNKNSSEIDPINPQTYETCQACQ